MSAQRRTLRAPHLTAVPDEPAVADNVAPTIEHRLAADAYLRGEPVTGRLADLLEEIVAGFGRTQHQYVRLAREAGEQARVWDTARRIIAQRLARAATRA